jgi:glycosyltransferase involved in cell wall biosynthesis
MGYDNHYNVIFVTQLPVPLKWAPAQRLQTFCRYLLKEGFNVHIIGVLKLKVTYSPRIRIVIEESLIKQDANISKCSETPISLYFITRNSYINSIINTILAFIQAIYLIIKKPDIIIVSVPPANLILASFLASQIIKAVYVVDIRDPVEEILLHYSRNSQIYTALAKILRKLNYAIYRKADAVIVVTEGIKEILKNNRINAITIPNGADIKIFRPVHKEKTQRDDLILVFSGVAKGYYDLRPFIVALRKLNDAGYKIKLLIVGDIEEDLEKFVKRVNASEYVNYLGYYSPEELASKVFSNCDIGVIPRINDPILDYAIPAKFYEYVTSGLPIFALSRKESALAKIILNYDIGWVCEYKDIECIIKTLKEIYQNRTLIGKKRKNALAIRYQFDRNTQARLLVKIIKALINFKHKLKHRRENHY